MQSSKRLFLCVLLSAAASVVQAQAWPGKPIRIVVPGAGGNVGSDHVAKSAPDGYTLLVGTSASHATNVSLYGSKMPYDAVKDFSPITLFGYTPLILMAHPGLGADSVKDLIARAKAAPGKINYGSSGNGTASHLGMEYVKRAAEIDVVHVPYLVAASGARLD